MFITTKEHSPEGVHASMVLLSRDWINIAKKIKPE
jgi:hypothetical protein